ncbi:hypothetical protein EDB81DRAFT_804134 [Dactylonectria macrodidyma]|uniref:Inhibitor I9 domain-containing protein n=1 Tax=Dactylonectria macrodidyma TaxID=307937 RepID=A0A9P9EAA2_9HYPO|nr:hypothetical protein EDB81DRAFT_804134 [Dactylonectria macrodidyma]
MAAQMVVAEVDITGTRPQLGIAGVSSSSPPNLPFATTRLPASSSLSATTPRTFIKRLSRNPAIMPTYIVSCKDDATPEQIQSAKDHAVEQGGKIEHEYSLIKGFSVSFPQDSITTLESHEHVKAVEADQPVHTQ